MIRAVLFDLDDTLYPQAAWLDGAWAAVAGRARELGLHDDAFEPTLRAVAAEGSDRGLIINRALARGGWTGIPTPPLVDAFRSWAPTELEPYAGVREGLRDLVRNVPVAIVTDGDPRIQQAKLQALQLPVAVVVFSDHLGRVHRKPDPLPFRRALKAVGVAAWDAVFVGDRPDKDVAGARAAGMRAVRVHTGEYAEAPDDPPPWRSVPTVIDAFSIVSTGTAVASRGL